MKFQLCRYLYPPLALVSQISSASPIDKNGGDGRGLSWIKIAGYEPLSNVEPQSRLDLDLQAFESQLALPDWGKAKQVFKFGGNADGYAQVTIPALKQAVQKRAIVRQGPGDGYAVGRVRSNAEVGATKLVVTYSSVCNALADTGGCFGTRHELVVGGINLGRPTSVEDGYLSLATLSMHAATDYNGWAVAYGAYYNDHRDYAYRLVINALDGTGAFAGLGTSPRREFSRRAAALLNVGMYSILKMEDAAMDCSGSADGPAYAWDEAVAFYVGSLEGLEGEGSGKFSYALADEFCAKFGTCAKDGTSIVNAQVIRQFKIGQIQVVNGMCGDTIPMRKRIIALMNVPVIQGLLYYAHKSYMNFPGEAADRGSGAAFAAAILPMVNACDPEAAKLIKEDMRMDSAAPMHAGFVPVKQALERAYTCMGITCDDVGGLLDDENSYYKGAEPCITPSPEVAAPEAADDDESQAPWLVATVILAVFLCCTSALAGYLYVKLFKYKKLKEVNATSPVVPGSALGPDQIPVQMVNDQKVNDPRGEVAANKGTVIGMSTN
eukprot:gnl/TRDRNA2_/TRDRNA2_198358_c0_seq1.p1 gnl/TRDRNA2_/TRDRNA2_198358_c0~~gnl/TRDRNA2_/TRDRNA2_198358_c0_seq1.p1  ORF type:complete len:551 (-),score=72.89 gnl/TRDRNA2_/TRDRNA2_198358_c0_seq1:30-1682(-)